MKSVAAWQRQRCSPSAEHFPEACELVIIRRLLPQLARKTVAIVLAILVPLGGGN